MDLNLQFWNIYQVRYFWISARDKIEHRAHWAIVISENNSFVSRQYS